MMRSRTEVRNRNLDLTLFVYGTLQSGFAAHTRYCRPARVVARARVRGALFEHVDGFPALVVAPSRVLAVGTADAIADARARVGTAYHRAQSMLASIAAPCRTIHGELLRLRASSALVAALDRYEGYRPRRPSLFVRVLVEVEPAAGPPILAWTYVAGALMPSASLRPLDMGRWPAGHRF